MPTDKQDQNFTTDFLHATAKATTTAANVVIEIQLIATRGSPLETILSFHSTCIMNLLTYRAACCLFPQLTLEEKMTLLIDLVSPLIEIQDTAVRKYGMRDFTILHQAPISMAYNANSALTFLRPHHEK
ncbi:hypothetical protein EV368DRAFT_90088 [Lentinula lateritia]|nr:hypothetical protein EV368DRAFT_90088 [Lentinula lateritia]